MNIEAMKQALENLDEYYITTPEGQKLVTALRQAIAEAEKQEHYRVAQQYLYTHPPKREWIGLTDDEIEDCYREGMIGKAARLLKEKNHG